MQPTPPATLQGSSLWRAGALIGGRYRLRAAIGAGAMGEVWGAEHVTLGTRVAVKLVDTADRPDAEETLGRFHQEARAAAQLRSPHVVQILDHGTDGRVAFIAMELLEGESLEDRIQRRGRLLPTEVAHLVAEMARGLDRAHAAGIVHRDIKPPNVFLARVDGVEVVKLLDFGIAKLLGAPREAQLQTQAGFVVGTPAYMSPEQVLGKPIDHRSDLWQVAMIAFECTTGTRPFDGATLGQLFMAICAEPLPVPSAVAMPGATELPAALQAFDAWFARAASRDPSRRFGSAGEMATALMAALAPGGVGPSAIPTLGTAFQPDVEPQRPRRAPSALLAGLSIASLLMLSAGGWWWWRARGGATTGASPPPMVSSSAPATSVTQVVSASLPPPPATSATAEPAPPAAASRPPARPTMPWKKPENDRIGL